MYKEPGICISGIGVVSPLGERVSENWESLKSGRCAPVPEIRGFIPSDYVKRRYLKPLDDVAVRCIAMTRVAMQDSGVDPLDIDPARVGVVVGSMFAGVGCIFQFKQDCYEAKQDNYLDLSPTYFPGIAFNSLSGQPAIEFGYTGPNSVVNAGFASGLLAVIKGLELIRSGKADVVIAGGAEMSHTFIRQKFSVLRNSSSVGLMGSNFQPSEAVCLFVLHKEDDQRFSRSRVYGMVQGWRYGFMPEGCSPDSVSRAIRSIPGINEDDVRAVVASSYGNSPLSEVEDTAVQQLLGANPSILLRNKENFGHALGASSGLDLFHGLMYSREELANKGTVLVNALDPGGNYAFVTLRSEGHFS